MNATTAKNRILSLALALCLALGMTLYLPGPVEVSAGIAKGVDGITRNSTTIGFAGVEWIVIGDATGGVQQAAGTLTLLAKNEGDFGTGQFNLGYFEPDYENSLLHGAMRDIYDGFADGREQGLINPVVLDDIVDSGGNAATLSDQYVWPLAWYEWDTTPRSSNWSSNWWLRSVNGTIPALVMTHGGIGGNPSHFLQLIRPALQLDVSDVLFISEAGGGKPAGPTLTAVSSPTGAIKLTVVDPALNSLALTLDEASSGAGSLSFNFARAATGANRTVSCVLERGGAVEYYAKLATGNSGSLTIDTTTVTPGTYTLRIFVEEENGLNETDFAGVPVDMTLVVDASGNGTVADYTNNAFSVTPQQLDIAAGETGTFDVDLGRPGSKAGTVTIVSDDPTIASATPTTLTANGQVTVTGEKQGSTVIDITFSGGDLAAPVTVPVTVNVTASLTPVPGVSKSSLELAAGETDTFFVSLGEGYNAAEGATITSNNTGVATVSPLSLGQSGDVKVTGVAKGNATVSIGYSGGIRHGKFDTVQVTVTEKDDGGNSNTGGTSGSRSSSRSSGGTPDSRVAKIQLPASAFSWDGRTLTIDHDSLTVLGLQSARWDGVVLTQGQEYSVYAGSVLVRFSEDFMAAQSPGEHTVRVEFLNHIGEATVTVGEMGSSGGSGDDWDGNDTHNPNTGDGGSVWTALLLSSLGAAALVFTGKGKGNEKL